MFYVASNVEIYTTLFGWIVFEIMWKAMSETGLVFIPFLVMLYQNMHDPYVSQDVKPAAITSFKRMKWDLIVTMIVLTLFLVPSKQLKVESVRYVSPPTFSNQSSTIIQGDANKLGHPKLKDKVLTGVNVPIGWLFVMSIGNGFNQYIQGELPHPADLRGAAMHLRTAYLGDEVLNNRVMEFSNVCHIPAAAKFRKNRQSLKELIRQNESTWMLPVSAQDDNHSALNYEASDISWMGSRILLNVKGLYKDCTPTSTSSCPIGTGFSVLRGKQVVYCDELWKGSVEKDISGIRSDIIEYARNDKSGDDSLSWWDKGDLALGEVFGAQSVAWKEDMLVREIIESNGESRTGLETTDAAYNSNMFTDSPILEMGGNVIKAWDTSGKLKDMSVQVSFMAYMGHQGLPIIKALILMALIWFIPLFFMVAGYHNVPRLMQLILAIFTVQMLTLFWNLGYWVDQSLAYLLYGGTSGVWDYVKGHFTGPHRLLLDVITTTFYGVVPTLFILMMTWAGMKIGQLGQVTQGSGQALDKVGADAAKDGQLGGAIESGVNKGVDKAKGAASKAIAAKSGGAAGGNSGSVDSYGAAKSTEGSKYPSGSPKGGDSW